MSPWRRLKKQSPPDRPPPGQGPGDEGDTKSEEQVDLLYDQAERLLMSQPSSPQSVKAAERAAGVAGILTITADTPANQRRLARGLWCSASALTAARDIPAAGKTAKLSWTVCCQLLDATMKDPVAFDEAVGLVVHWCADLGPALDQAGLKQDAAKMAKVCYDIAVGSPGPHALHARARIALNQLGLRADGFARASLDGRMGEVAAELQEAITLGRDSLRVLRAHAVEGPYEVAEVARMLQVLSRLYVAAGLLDDVAPALDEAVVVAASVADRGPAFAGLLTYLQAERDALTSIGSQEEIVLPTTSLGRAFERAASDIGGGVGVLFPDDIAETAAMVERIQEQEPEFPGILGPMRGLAMAWHAQLLARAGWPAEAAALAGQATRQLMRFSDAPDKIQAALAVALTVEATAWQAAGDESRARSAQERAAAIRTLLVRRDSTYADDLGPP